jgi:hypothetical protein
MPYEADIFKVMIASPSDVSEEKKIARQIIYDWNDLHSEKAKIVLLPISWETHSSPEMGDRPQAIINKQVLKNADLLIGIFWTRIGTPTGKSSSGTVEEIEEHIQSGKPVMLYFSKKLVLPDNIDQEQYNKLKEFKKSCQGLFNEYTTVVEFQDNLRKHLILKINEHSYFKIQQKISDDHNLNTVPIDQSITLSEESKQLIIESSKDKTGYILKIRTSGGNIIQTNGKNLISSPKDPRVVAKWEYAIKELLENVLIEGKGNKGEVFALTHKGYEYADRLKISFENEKDSTENGDLKFNPNIGIYISNEKGLSYCGKCLDSIPSHKVPLIVKENGWRCNVCDKFYINPGYNPPSQEPYNPLDSW